MILAHFEILTFEEDEGIRVLFVVVFSAVVFFVVIVFAVYIVFVVVGFFMVAFIVVICVMVVIVIVVYVGLVMDLFVIYICYGPFGHGGHFHGPESKILKYCFQKTLHFFNCQMFAVDKFTILPSPPPKKKVYPLPPERFQTTLFCNKKKWVHINQLYSDIIISGDKTRKF